SEVGDQDQEKARPKAFRRHHAGDRLGPAKEGGVAPRMPETSLSIFYGLLRILRKNMKKYGLLRRIPYLPKNTVLLRSRRRSSSHSSSGAPSSGASGSASCRP